MRIVLLVAGLIASSPLLAADADADRVATELVSASTHGSGVKAQNEQAFKEKTTTCTRELFAQNHYNSEEVSLMREFIAHTGSHTSGDLMARFQQSPRVVAFFRDLSLCQDR